MSKRKSILLLVEQYLTKEPKARERKNRARAIWRILEKYLYGDSIGIGSMNMEFFMNNFSKIDSINRSINRIQKLNPPLRGTDYDEKKALQQQAQVDLGYTPGYHQDIKKLNTL